MSDLESNLDQLLKARAEIDKQLRRHQTAVAILFTDVVGSTAYFDRYGDIAGAAMLHRHAQLAGDAVAEHAGRVIKTIGDSVMAEFAESLDAVRAAVEIQRRLLRLNQTLDERDRLQLRIGIHHGTCVRHGTDVFGDGVNVAARVTKRTGPGQILISRSVHNSIGSDPHLRCEWLAEVTLSGKAEKEALYEVIWTDTATYVGLRENLTLAVKRGELTAPGLEVEELVPSSFGQEPVSATPPPDAAAPAAPPEEFRTPAPQALASRYELLSELGSGGMGVVYKARDRETGDYVALKVLRSELASDAEGLARFKNELRVARRITHKNICRIHEFNRIDGTAYISMEYLEGENLRRMIRRTGGLSPEEGVPIASQICAGLAEAHTQGVVHRDLKPENVIIDAAGLVKVMDFGIARSSFGANMTQTGAVVGTPAYMAPEQAQGATIDHRADIYAVGLILFEMFTGLQPFRAETPVALMVKHLQEPPPPPRQFKPDLPEWLERAILRSLEKRPENRFSSAAELAQALEVGLQTGELPAVTTAATPPAPTQAVPRAAPPPAPTVQIPAPAPVPVAAQRNWTVIGGVIGAVAVVGVLAVFLLNRPGQERPVEQTAAPTPAQPAPPITTPSEPTVPVASPQSDTQGEAKPAEPETSEPASSARGRVVELPERPRAEPPRREPVPSLPAASSPSIPAALPVTANFTLGRTLAGHTAAVSGVAFTSDGRYVASGGMDRTVRVWEAGSGRQVQLLKGHSDAVTAVSFSPDGNLLVSASSDRTLRVWDPQSGREIQATPKEPALLLSVAFHPGGRAVAAGRADGRIRIWEVPGDSVLRELEGHNGPVYTVVFSADGRKLVSAGRDATVRIWEVQGEGSRVMRGHAGPVNAAAISRDSRLVVSGSDDLTVRLWEVATGRELRVLTGHTAGIEGVAFSPDGRWVASAGGDKTVRVWEVATGRELHTLEGHLFSISDLTVSSDGRWLASAAGDKTIKLWRRSD